ncbi:hypothetical protein J1N35_023074 [Gossypium stocksii]|uniref:Uncharacterized protein n=1 Tax=Gossypium stocksii TaxID=47602 RepID=A0A9D3VI54_9ROSI|nr:hypothetical protein J1N35_023074 [Gossypium stocksii]
MSEHINVVIYYDGEVRHTENSVIFLSYNTVRLVFNQNIDLTELHKRIRRKIFETTSMKVLSIKYRFCALVDPVTYDSFEIKSARTLEAMGRYETSRRRDDVLPITSTGEETSYVADDSGLDNESDVDPSQEPGLDGAEVALFSELKPVLTEPEDVERGSDEEKEDP